jgi:hypothetical protein
LDLDEVEVALKRAAALATNGTREERAGRILFSSVEYDDEGRELWVTFTDGKAYHYRDVPAEVYDGLLAAESWSDFFNSRIKNVFTLADNESQAKVGLQPLRRYPWASRSPE